MLNRLAINETTTFGWQLDQEVEAFLAAGIHAMGVWRAKLSDFGTEKGIELLADSGIAVSSLMWAGGFTGDVRTHQESIDDAVEAVHLAASLHADCLILYSGPQAGHIRRQAERLVDSALHAILPVAESSGVVVALEPVHQAVAFQSSFWTQLQQVVDVLRRFDSPHLRLVLDTYHMMDEPRLVERLAEIVDSIALVQLSDARQPPRDEQNRCPLGDGCVPLREIVRELLRRGYSGFFEVELHGEDCEALDNNDLIQRSIEAYKKLVSDD